MPVGNPRTECWNKGDLRMRFFKKYYFQKMMSFSAGLQPIF
jgi:hypothetical protein